MFILKQNKSEFNKHCQFDIQKFEQFLFTHLTYYSTLAREVQHTYQRYLFYFWNIENEITENQCKQLRQILQKGILPFNQQIRKSAEVITMLQRLKITPWPIINKVFNKMNISINIICSWEKVASRQDKINEFHHTLKNVIQMVKKQQKKYQIKKPRALIRRLEVASLQNGCPSFPTNNKLSEISLRLFNESSRANRSYAEAVAEEIKYKQYYELKQFSILDKSIQVQNLKKAKSSRAKKQNEKVQKKKSEIKQKKCEIMEGMFQLSRKKNNIIQYLAKTSKCSNSIQNSIQFMPRRQYSQRKKNNIEPVHKDLLQKDNKGRQQMKFRLSKRNSISEEKQKISTNAIPTNQQKLQKQIPNKQKHRQEVFQRKKQRQKIELQRVIKQIVFKENKILNKAQRKTQKPKNNMDKVRSHAKRYQQEQQRLQKKRQQLQDKINSSLAQSRFKKAQNYRLNRQTCKIRQTPNIQNYQLEQSSFISENCQKAFPANKNTKEKLNKIKQKNIKKIIKNKNEEQIIDRQILKLRKYSIQQLKILYSDLTKK